MLRPTNLLRFLTALEQSLPDEAVYFGSTQVFRPPLITLNGA